MSAGKVSFAIQVHPVANSVSGYVACAVPKRAEGMWLSTAPMSAGKVSFAIQVDPVEYTKREAQP